jgi:hypothetical protein
MASIAFVGEAQGSQEMPFCGRYFRPDPRVGERLKYEGLEVLFCDGEAGIESNLLAEGMRIQRCVWHGKRDFSILLYHDGWKKSEQQPLLERPETIPLFFLTREVLEKDPPPEKEVIVGLVEEISAGFRKLFEALDPEKYPKAWDIYSRRRMPQPV